MASSARLLVVCYPFFLLREYPLRYLLVDADKKRSRGVLERRQDSLPWIDRLLLALPPRPVLPRKESLVVSWWLPNLAGRVDSLRSLYLSWFVCLSWGTCVLHGLCNTPNIHEESSLEHKGQSSTSPRARLLCTKTGDRRWVGLVRLAIEGKGTLLAF